MSQSRVAEITSAIRNKERKAREVVEEHLARIDTQEKDLNALITVMAEQALQRADEIDAQVVKGEEVGSLAGVPVAIKDMFCTKDVQTTAGSRILEGWIPPYNATTVSRLLEAGAVPIGKANCDEFGMGSSMENSGYGVSRNPHDLDRVPGGSSGGSAVAVAAGYAPIATGTDTGGSSRQPAALCGVVGIKPTYGRISRYGVIAFASSLDSIGAFSADVASGIEIFQTMAGHDPMDSTSIDQPVPDYRSALTQGVDGLRVGIVNEMMGEGISGEVQEKVRQAAAVLENNGAKVDVVNVPAATFGLSSYYIIAPAEASSNLARYDGVRYGIRREGSDVADMYSKTRSVGFGPEVKRRIMLGTYALSAGYYDAYYGKAQKVRTLIIRDFDAAFSNFDLLLSPTAPTTAFKIGEKVDDIMAMYLNDVCTLPVNLAGIPAMSVPFGTGAGDLPIGVQIMAPALGEHTMFRAAAVLEGNA